MGDFLYKVLLNILFILVFISVPLLVTIGILYLFGTTTVLGITLAVVTFISILILQFLIVLNECDL